MTDGRSTGATRAVDLALVALFASLTAAGAFVRIPFPLVPVTLQGFFVTLAALLLGARRAFLSQVLYLAIGLAGLPVFASGGGVAYVMRPSFGYLLGYAAGAYAGGLVVKKAATRGRPPLAVYAMASGVVTAAAYLVGVPYLFFISNHVLGVPISASSALTAGCLVFLPGDALKALGAAWLARQVGARVVAAGAVGSSPTL